MASRLVKPLSRPFDLRLVLPGSKSYANRALVCAALAGAPCTVANISPGDDTALMLNVLSDLGWSVSRANPLSTDARLRPPRGRSPASGRIWCGNAGTVARFAAALLAVTPGNHELDGDNRMRQRPMAPLIDALRQIGAKITELGAPGALPLAIEGGSLRGSRCEISGAVSSQFISALLLVAPHLPDGLEVRLRDRPVSASYIDMTLEVLRAFGVPAAAIRRTASRMRVQAAHLSCPHYPCPPDATAAGYFWAAAAVTGSSCVIDGLSADNAQGDVGVIEILRAMGCRVLKPGGGLGVRGPARLRGFEADFSGMPDSAQTMAVAATFASGPSLLRGLKTLRGKETDRLAALATELPKLGAVVAVKGDSLRITPGPVPTRPARIRTFGDHRMAMSFALAGLRAPGVRIEEPGVVSKSFPGFWSLWERLYAAT